MTANGSVHALFGYRCGPEAAGFSTWRALLQFRKRRVNPNDVSHNVIDISSIATKYRYFSVHCLIRLAERSSVLLGDLRQACLPGWVPSRTKSKLRCYSLNFPFTVYGFLAVSNLDCEPFV